MARKQITNSNQILSALCLAQEKWGLYILPNTGDLDPKDWMAETAKAAPWLTCGEMNEVMFSSDGSYFLFDSEQEMKDAYNQTVGDDGPTNTNPYDGVARVYCLTCDPMGQCRTENT